MYAALVGLVEKPLHLTASVATKIQVTATHVALKAARAAAHFTEKAARLQAAATARAAELARVRALKVASRPGVHFLRDVRQGQMRVSFFRSIDKKGVARTFWTLSRETGHGPKRLATGTMAEFRDFRRLAERLPTHQRTSELQRVRQPPRAPAGPRQGQRSEKHLRASEEPPREQWYSLVFKEGSLGHGTVQTRVVRNFRDVNKALAATRNDPRLAVYHRPSEKPRPQGAVITAQEANFFRPQPQQQRHASPDASRVNGLARSNEQSQELSRRLQQSR